MLEDVVICEPVRTPVGRFGGQFRDLHAHELGRIVIEGLLARTNLPGDRVDEVIFAQCYPSMDAPALGRVVGLDAGLPISIGGYQIDRRCGSGLQAVINAVMQVATGGSSLVIAGGAESMSNAPFYSTKGRWGIKGTAMVFDDALAKGRVTAGGINHPVPGGMLETAENLRQEYNIGREEQDAFAVESHRRAVAAQDGGLFDDEIIPVIVKHRKGEDTLSKDEHPRPEVTMESMAKLRAIRGGVDERATVTAGNASGQNDGASAAIITTRAIAAELGLKAYARIKSWAVAGVGPEVMGIGPVPSVAKALDRAGMALKDIDLIELNEAFAAQVLACTREWQFADSDFERMNVNGSGISLGHPVGATGGRIMAGLLREMHRRDALYGVETMCIGGGQGLAAIFEKV
ncbi:acetyl-CoA C-acetyltransferase [Phaeobacter gallaeciensis]|jgi:acetyl-CoA C-acetyltransferase|uniref:acetyl-CoA C-acetyltransferase n=1 Tax=Phaeobacter gallaeciensis TaxID=60890 RepID=UPI00237FCFE9|nr:acetyl-CoA C-acetyltransferase [Phaeobacter gallaeciensis]MDE4305909.1 acetyl-CoA C-acetyltransferase [Phaeobacter gallaeciensis]MDE4310258.1 acetyl-CoA C-acetyltransferase [Phaeobacter gallaeciensis]MDE4314628.1 acetyl-CoA C-acetyltransferase [Phaeobacter gallaeciensis]MDE4319187.1 acetyl-CoA C-acetyltransferase [Phaeobacter gallaeciensis]MDE4323994.1 acetyl-CoA C-acetyltransferase [Phaeobacter gallaeciensis]